jgi:hypothetical protein
MRPVRLQALGLFALAAAFAAGTWTDRRARPTVQPIAGYEILAADFHVHSFPFSWSTLSPFDTVIEADRQRLDAIAMTPHNSAERLACLVFCCCWCSIEWVLQRAG